MQRHLSTLSILHYVYGAFVCLSGLAALVIILVGGFLSSDLLNEATDGERIPAFVGVLVQSLGWVILVVVEMWGGDEHAQRFVDREPEEPHGQSGGGCVQLPEHPVRLGLGHLHVHGLGR